MTRYFLYDICTSQNSMLKSLFKAEYLGHTTLVRILRRFAWDSETSIHVVEKITDACRGMVCSEGVSGVIWVRNQLI